MPSTLHTQDYHLTQDSSSDSPGPRIRMSTLHPDRTISKTLSLQASQASTIHLGNHPQTRPSVRVRVPHPQRNQKPKAHGHGEHQLGYLRAPRQQQQQQQPLHRDQADGNEAQSPIHLQMLLALDSSTTIPSDPRADSAGERNTKTQIDCLPEMQQPVRPSRISHLASPILPAPSGSAHRLGITSPNSWKAENIVSSSSKHPLSPQEPQNLGTSEPQDLKPTLLAIKYQLHITSHLISSPLQKKRPPLQPGPSEIFKKSSRHDPSPSPPPSPRPASKHAHRLCAREQQSDRLDPSGGAARDAGHALDVPTEQPHFQPTFPLTHRPSGDADVTSILAVLTSVQSIWTAGSQYPSITAAVYDAAPTSARTSLDRQGYDWNVIVQEPWYAAVPTALRSLVAGQEEALQSAFDNVSAQVASSASRGPRSAVGAGLEMGAAWVSMAMLLGLVVGSGMLW
ncbi:unnamed protein product [Diplocarpon coronariae]